MFDNLDDFNYLIIESIDTLIECAKENFIYSFLNVI